MGKAIIPIQPNKDIMYKKYHSLFFYSILFITYFLGGIKYSIAESLNAQPENQNPDSYCFLQAGEKYKISPTLLWAISRVESKIYPYAVNYNGHKSVDVGHMQINSCWYSKIGKARWDYLFDPCYCTNIGAWILSDCIARFGNTWKAIACYNCGKDYDKLSPTLKIRVSGYVSKVYRELNYAQQYSEKQLKAKAHFDSSIIGK